MTTYEVSLHETTNMRCVSFYDDDRKTILTVPVGMYAASTFFKCHFKQSGRTEPVHRMFARMTESLGGTLRALVIDGLRKGTFYATIYFTDHEDSECSIRLFAGDALAIAFNAPCEVYVRESVLDAAQNDRENRVQWYSSDNEDAMKTVRAYSAGKLGALPGNELEQLLEIATETEDFEFAARIKKAMTV